jgi:hypothetical protein
MSRRRIRRACATASPTVLNSRSRSRFGRAVRKASGKGSRLSAESKLYISVFNRIKATFAPNFSLGSAAAASSFLRT